MAQVVLELAILLPLSPKEVVLQACATTVVFWSFLSPVLLLPCLIWELEPGREGQHEGNDQDSLLSTMRPRQCDSYPNWSSLSKST